jgi:hypothetical protein
MPARIFSSVDLPVPLPPTRPVRSSGVISQLTSSNNNFWPNRFPAAESWSIPPIFSSTPVARSKLRIAGWSSTGNAPEVSEKGLEGHLMRSGSDYLG